MERRYETRLKEMLIQAQGPCDLVTGLLERLESFAKPYASALAEPEQRQHTVEYIRGLLSKLDHKTGEAIAYLHDQERQGIQKFIGHVPWDHQPLLTTLAQQVATDLGEPDAVIVFDPSSFPKKGTKSVGVARQWCGRLGKIENCQVAVYMGLCGYEGPRSGKHAALSPQEWAEVEDPANRGRCAQGHFVPDTSRVSSGDAGRTRITAAALVGGGRR